MSTYIGRLARAAVNQTVKSNANNSSYSLRAVGALTSKPYAFKSRNWELKSTESIDVLDGVGSNIRIDTRGSEIMRVIPRLNENVNEEWIADKTRFSYDGLKRQRLSTPMVRTPDGNLVPVSWDRIRLVLKNSLLNLEFDHPNGYESHAIIGPYIDVSAALELRNMFYRWFPNGKIHVQEQAQNIPTDFRYNYMCNITLPELETADVVLLIGTDPRMEAPILNTRLRKAALYHGLTVGNIGTAVNLTYPVQHLGTTLDTLKEISDRKHPFAKLLKDAERPVVMVSNRALQRADGAGIFSMIEKVIENTGAEEDWDPLCVLHTGANTVGLLDLGFDCKYSGQRALDNGSWEKTKVLYLLGADDIDNIKVDKDCLVIYQGHHGDRGAAMADIILPGAAYTEKTATFVNTEGRVQKTKLAFFPPGLADDDATVIRNLVGTEEIEQDASGVMNGATLEMLAPHLLRENSVQKADRIAGNIFSKEMPVFNTPLQPPVSNYYMTDPITRSSKTMAKCTKVKKTSNFL